MTAAVWAGYDEPDAEQMRDWTQITIRPVFEVACPDCARVLGYTARADQAHAMRRAHWDDEHGMQAHGDRNPTAAGDVHNNDLTN